MSAYFHFLNVGHGDCTIIYFPERQKSDGTVKDERIMIIDCNHYEDHESYENVITYYKENFGSKNIFRFILTHPHKDHITGLNKLFNDNGISILNFWCVDNSFEPEEFEDEEHDSDWREYVKAKNGDHPFKVLNYTADDKPGLYWNDDEDRITILSPSKKMINEVHADKEDGTPCEPSEIEVDYISYALLIQINEIKILLAGDAKEDAWRNEIYPNYKNLIKNCKLLKAAHHGHASGIYDEAVEHIYPDYIIFSNSRDYDDKEGAETEYEDLINGVQVYKTCDYGTIIAEITYKNQQIILRNKIGHIIN